MSKKSFCFFAHVDSGKSTVAGHLLYLLSHISDHEFQKLYSECEKEKALYQLYSRILDVNEEERQKGKTNEYTIVDLNYKDASFQLIDTPGHKNYIREMINGLSHFETSRIIGCFLLSAKKGEFESGWTKGQSKEHLLIARSLGIKDLVILVNKMDMCDWKEEEFSQIKSQSEPFIKGVCGFKNYTYIPISGYKGEGLVTDPPCTWFKGKSLMDTLLDLNVEEKHLVKELEVNTFHSIVAKVKVISCESIITTGYKCIIHFCGKEYECEITKMNKKFLKSKESANCLLVSKELISSTYLSRRFLIRNALNTIGFGEIIKVA